MAAIPILRFFLPYIFGLVCALEFDIRIAHTEVFLICVISLFIFQILAFRSKAIKYREVLNLALSFIIPFSFLIMGVYQGAEQNSKHHFHSATEQWGCFEIVEVDSFYGYNKITAEILWLEKDKEFIGETVLFDRVKKLDQFQARSQITANIQLKEFEHIADPFQFDPKQFYRSHGIYLNPVINYISEIHEASSVKKPKTFFNELRKKLLGKFQILFQKYNGFMSALILGDRTDLDPLVKEEFIMTGSMHVLAVSGLHVGSIYLILSTIFNTLFKQRWVLLLIVPMIWIYAELAGFGEPVQRASIMLSIITIGKVIQRDGNGLNTLFITGFILLVLDPDIYNSVSFRFSFMAVLSIMLFYGRLSRLYVPSYYLGKAIWQLTCLGISAQILVAPLSIYYFDQFSLAFPLSGILVVPYVIAVFYCGGITLSLSYISDELSLLLAKYCEMLLDFALWINHQIATIPKAFINEIDFELVDVLIYYSLVVLVFLYIRSGKVLNLILFISALSYGTMMKVIHEEPKLVILKGQHPTFILQDRNEAYIITDDLRKGNGILSKKELRIAKQLGIKETELLVLPYDLLHSNFRFEGLKFFGNGSFSFRDALVHTDKNLYHSKFGIGVFPGGITPACDSIQSSYKEYELKGLSKNIVLDPKCHSIVIRM